MAESKGSLLAKSVQKHAGRAKEKVGLIHKKKNKNEKEKKRKNQLKWQTK